MRNLFVPKEPRRVQSIPKDIEPPRQQNQQEPRTTTANRAESAPMSQRRHATLKVALLVLLLSPFLPCPILHVHPSDWHAEAKDCKDDKNTRQIFTFIKGPDPDHIRTDPTTSEKIIIERH